MSGIAIDIDTEASAAKRDLNELNKSLAKLVSNSDTSTRALGRIQTNNFKSINKDLTGTTKSFEQFGSRGLSALQSINKASLNVSNSLNGIKSAAIALGTAFAAIKGITELNKAADSLTNIQNKLKLVTSTTSELVRTQEQLYSISKSTRSSLSETADIYVNFSKALENTNISQDKILSVVKTIQQSVALSGTSAEGAKGALMQLGQGIASGTLRGEELNAVLEQMKYLGIGLQTELGKNTGQLRKFAEDGSLTTEVLIRAIGNLASKTEEDFASTTSTVEVAANQFKQSLSLMAAEANKSLGTSERLAKFLINTSNSIDAFSTKTKFSLERSRLNFLTYFRSFQVLDPVEVSLSDLFSLDYSFDKVLVKYKALTEIQNALNFLSSDAAAGLSLRLKVKAIFDLSFEDMSDFSESIKTALPVVLFNKSIDELKIAADTAARQNPYTNFFIIMRDNWKKLVPVIQTPIQTINIDFQRFIERQAINLKYFKRSFLYPLKTALTSFKDTTLYATFDDTRLERAWVKLFKSKSISDFELRLQHLNELRSKIKLDNWALQLTEVSRSQQDFAYAIEDTLIYLNIFDNSLLRIRDTRFDRLITYLKEIGSASSRVLTEVFLWKLERRISLLSLSIQTFKDKYRDAFSDVFSESAGVALGSRIRKSLLNTYRLFSQTPIPSIDFDKSAVKAIIASFKSIFGAIYNTLKGFIKGLFEDSFDGIIDGLSSATDKFQKKFIKKLRDLQNKASSAIRSAISAIPDSISDFDFKVNFDLSTTTLGDVGEYLRKTFEKAYDKTLELLNKIDALVAKFSKTVKFYFWDIYDKVVGNSYWPDMVDEVVAYSSNLFGAESVVESFSNKIKSLFSSIQKKVASDSSNIGNIFRTLISNISRISLSDIANSLSKNMGGAIIAAIFLLSGNTRLAWAATTYFYSLFNGALAAITVGVSVSAADLAGRAVAGFTEKFVVGLIKGFDSILEVLPSFVQGFLNAINPLSEEMNNLFSGIYSIASFVFPSIGTLLNNNLIYGLLTASALLAILNKDARKFLGTFIFGKEGKKGKPDQEGALSYLSTLLPDFLRTMESPIQGLFKNNKLALLGAAAFSTALLESISLAEASMVGLPLLAFAFLGKDGGGKLTRTISSIVETLFVSVYRAFYKMTAFMLGEASIISRVLKKPLDLFDWFFGEAEKKDVKETSEGLWTDIKQMGKNLKDNADAYGANKLSLWDALITPEGYKEPSVGKVPKSIDELLAEAFDRDKPAQKVDIKKSLQDFFRPLTDFKVNNKSIGMAFNDIYYDVSVGVLRIREAFQSGKVDSSIKTFATSLFAGIGNAVRAAISLITDGFLLLGTLLKNKFVLFTILAALVTTFATAAESADSSVSSLSSTLGSTLSTILALTAGVAALGVAFRAFKKYKEGANLFKDISSGAFIQEDLRSRIKKAAVQANAKMQMDLEKKVNDFSLNRSAILAKSKLDIDRQILQKTLTLRELSTKRIEDREKLVSTLRALENRRRAADEIKSELAKNAVLEKIERVKQKLIERNARREAASYLAASGVTTQIKGLKEKKKTPILDSPEILASYKKDTAKKLKLQMQEDLKLFRDNEIEKDKLLASIQASGSAKRAGLLNLKNYFSSIKEKASSIISPLLSIVTPDLNIKPETLFNLQLAVKGLGDAFRSLSKGNFSDAFSKLKTYSKDAGSAIKDIGVEIASAFFANSKLSFLKRLTDGFKLLGDAIKTRVLMPLLLLVLPFIKIIAIGTAMAAVVGLLGLHFFGPDETNFVEKLDWAYDKLRAIFGLEAKTGTGRKSEIDNLLGSLEVQNQKLSEIYSALDFEKLDTTQFEAYKEVAEALANTIKDLNKLEIKQGGLTISQKEERAAAVQNFERLSARLPATKARSPVEGLRELSSAILKVDNSAWAMTKRFLLTIPILAKVSEATKAVGSAFADFMSGLWNLIVGAFAGATAGAIIGFLGGPIGALGGAIIGAFIAAINIAFPKLTSSLVKISSAVANWFGDAFNQMKFNASLYFEWFRNKMRGYEEKPSAEAKKRSAILESYSGELEKYSSKLSPEDLKALDIAKQRAVQAEDVLKQLEGKKARADKDDTLANIELEKELLAARIEQTNAFGTYLNLLKDKIPQARDKLLAEDLTKKIKDITSAAKDLSGVDFGKDGMEFFGTSDDLANIDALNQKIIELNRSYSTLVYEEDRRDNLLAKKAAAAQIANIKAVSDAFATPEGAFKKISDVAGVPVSAIRNIPNVELKFDDIQKSIYKIGELEASIESASISGIGNVKKLKGELSNLKEALFKRLQGSTFIDDINAGLKQLSIPEIEESIGRRIGEKQRAAVGASVSKALSAKMTQDDTNLTPQARQEAKQVAAFEAFNASQQVATTTANVLKDLNASTGEATALTVAAFKQEVPSAIGRTNAGLTKWNKLSLNIYNTQKSIDALYAQATIEQKPVSQNALVTLFAQKDRLEEELSKLSEKVVFSFDTMKSSLSAFGIELDLVTFSGLSSSAQNELAKLGKELEATQKKLSEKGVNAATGAALDKLVALQAEKAKRAFDIISKSTKYSGSVLFDSLTSLGLESFNSLTAGALKAFVGLDNELKLLKQQFSNVVDIKDDKALASYIQRLKDYVVKQRQLKRLIEDSNASFESGLTDFNEVFKASISGADLASFGDNVVSELTSAAVAIKRKIEDVLKFGGNISTGVAESLYSALAEIDTKGATFNFISEFRNELRKTTYEGAKAGFDRLKEAIPSLNLGFDEFVKLDASKRRALATQSLELTQLRKAAELPNLSEGMADILNSFKPGDDLQATLKAFSDLFLKETQSSFGDALKPANERVITASNRVADSLDSLNKTTDGLNTTLGGKPIAAITAKDAAIGITPNKTPGDIVPKTFANFASQEAIIKTNTLNDLLAQGSNLSIAKTYSGIDPETLNRASAGTLASIAKLSEGLEKQKIAFGISSNEAKPAIQASIDNYTYQLSSIAERINEQATAVRDAGVNFATNLTSSLSSSLKDLLKGKSEENKTALQTFVSSVLDAFTSSVIDTFVDGLMSPLTGKDGIISNAAKSLGSSVFSIFGSGEQNQINPDPLAMPSTDLAEVVKGPFQKLISGISEGFDSFKTGIEDLDISGIFSELGNSLSAGASGLFNMVKDIPWGEMLTKGIAMLGFASGGYVSGKGTATSDSIPAMLSNGEFVINAKATKQFGPLLNSINTGAFGKFAEGGLISTNILQTPRQVTIDSAANAQRSNSQQIINLSITGDISRQTRAEIYSMLPSIAEGVNLQNREKGYR